MPKICYIDRKFTTESRAIITTANEIIEAYAEDGYDLTLRQLYYQFISKNTFPNTEKSYRRLASIINDARLAGLIDWSYIVDRTRELVPINAWDSPREIINAVAKQFKIDKWRDQPYRVEVWIEKDALAGVFGRVCAELRVPYLACRGYTSQSEMWRAGQRLGEYMEAGQEPVVLHFGDHDPSGIDMSRDIEERLALFMGGVEFHRLALNMDQVNLYTPPPNPAKLSDARSAVYVHTFGHQSWELDALNPDILSGLVRDRITAMIDQEKWDQATEEEDEHRRLIGEVADQWEHLTENL